MRAFAPHSPTLFEMAADFFLAQALILSIQTATGVELYDEMRRSEIANETNSRTGICSRGTYFYF